MSDKYSISDSISGSFSGSLSTKSRSDVRTFEDLERQKHKILINTMHSLIRGEPAYLRHVLQLVNISGRVVRSAGVSVMVGKTHRMFVLQNKKTKAGQNTKYHMTLTNFGGKIDGSENIKEALEREWNEEMNTYDVVHVLNLDLLSDTVYVNNKTLKVFQTALNYKDPIKWLKRNKVTKNDWVNISFIYRVSMREALKMVKLFDDKIEGEDNPPEIGLVILPMDISIFGKKDKKIRSVWKKVFKHNAHNPLVSVPLDEIPKNMKAILEDNDNENEKSSKRKGKKKSRKRVKIKIASYVARFVFIDNGYPAGNPPPCKSCDDEYNRRKVGYDDSLY